MSVLDFLKRNVSLYKVIGSIIFLFSVIYLFIIPIINLTYVSNDNESIYLPAITNGTTVKYDIGFLYNNMPIITRTSNALTCSVDLEECENFAFYVVSYNLKKVYFDTRNPQNSFSYNDLSNDYNTQIGLGLILAIVGIFLFFIPKCKNNNDAQDASEVNELIERDAQRSDISETRIQSVNENP